MARSCTGIELSIATAESRVVKKVYDIRNVRILLSKSLRERRFREIARV